MPALFMVSLVGLPSVSARTPQTGTIHLFVIPQAHASPVLNLIRSARHSLRLEVYLLTNRPIVRELQRAQQRGVDVRVMLEKHPFRSTRYALLGYALLRGAGIPVRWANERYYALTHEKAMVVDNSVAGIFTFNLTSSGLYRNREFGVIDANPQDAHALDAIFESDWRRLPPAHLLRSHLVVSPYNSRRGLTSLIDDSRRTLDMYAEELDDATVEDHLIRAERRGARVRILTSLQSSGVDALRSGGVQVKLQKSPYVHAKAAVADGETLFVGSENVSSESLDRNREAGLKLSNAGLARQIEATFSSDWGEGAPAVSPSTGVERFRLSVTVEPTSAHRGQEVTIVASATPGAACSVSVTYPDGYVSRARALSGVKVVGAAGTVRWAWHVGSRVTGSSDVRVSCERGAARGSATATFAIE
ncbi:MAG: phospholipase D-like domain-containing protein [Chloroflexota bacterium]